MNQDMKDKYLELQLLNSQMQQIQQQVQTADMQASEMNRLAASLEEAKSINKGQELLVPLGQGIFMRAKAEDLKHVIMSVGADVVVEKTLDEAIEIVNKQLAELNNIILEMKHEFNEGVQKIHLMQHEMNELGKNDSHEGHSHEGHSHEKKTSKKK